jgi:aspartyl-tRNA(Asn)/glutamyl-tRNA(Gln) amidotransferase subunit C
MISESEVRKLASLAHLSLSDEELASLMNELGSILDYVKQLEAIDVANVDPMSHVHGSTNVFREDVVAESLDIKELLKNAPDTSGRFFKTPIIVE